MFSWLQAKFYDHIMKDAEEKCLHDWRRTLLQGVSGDVLELGCGTGANLAFYPASINSLALAEPDKHMRKKLAEKLALYPALPTSVLDYNGKDIPLPSNSIDSVVSTLVFCSVENPPALLAEIYRVLKPQGKLFFIEHVAADNNPGRFKWQQRIEPIWKIICCGCHLTRTTEQSIAQAGFSLQDVTRQSIRGVPPIARPSIRGCAVK